MQRVNLLYTAPLSGVLGALFCRTAFGRARIQPFTPGYSLLWYQCSPGAIQPSSPGSSFGAASGGWLWLGPPTL
jgi:hypothetical protein